MFVSILSLRWSFRELWRPVRHVRPCIISYATPILQSRECVDLRFLGRGMVYQSLLPKVIWMYSPLNNLDFRGFVTNDYVVKRQD